MKRILRSSDIVAAEIAIPSGHRHLRCVLYLRDGGELVFPEATLAALVRGYIGIKTHPTRRSVRLEGRHLGTEGKEDFAEWQLLETAEGQN